MKKPAKPPAKVPKKASRLTTARIKKLLMIEGFLRSGNLAEAARAAGYSPSTAATHASRWLASTELQEHIENRLAQAQVQTDEVVGNLVSFSRSNIEPFLRFDKRGRFTLDLAQARDLGVLQWLRELSYDQYGRPKIKLVDALDATKHLAKVLGLERKAAENPQDYVIVLSYLKKAIDIQNKLLAAGQSLQLVDVLREMIAQRPALAADVPLLSRYGLLTA